MNTITQIRPRRWLHAETGLFVWLPCDKRTFRVGNRDGDEQTSRRFRSLETAVAFLDSLSR